MMANPYNVKPISEAEDFVFPDEPRWYDFVYEGKGYCVAWDVRREMVDAFVKKAQPFGLRDIDKALVEKYFSEVNNDATTTIPGLAQTD